LNLCHASFVPSKTEPAVTFTIGHGQAFLILGLQTGLDTSPLLSVHKNVVTDKFNNGNLPALVGISVDAIDEIEPQLIGSAFVPGSGVLSVFFDEEVDPLSVVEGSFSVRVPGASTGGVTLSLTTSIVSVGNSIEITVSDAQRVAINALIDLPAASAPNPIELDVLAGAVADLAGNTVLETNDASIFVQGDTLPPFILSATFDESFNLLKITFTENIDVTPVAQVDLSGIFVTEDGTFDANVLTGATVNNLVDGNPISITITDAQKAGINALTTPMLDLSAGAFSDLSGNLAVPQSVPLTLTPTDITPPVILSAEFDDSFGLIRIVFDEVLDTTPDSQVDLSRVFISESGGIDENALTLATLLTTSDDSTVEIELTAAQITTLTGLTAPELDVSAGAFIDKNANPIDPTPDTTIVVAPTDVTKPQIQSSTFDISDGLLTITFDEEIDASSVDLSKVFVSEQKKRNQNALTGAISVTSVGNTIIIDTTASQEAIILGLSSPELDVGKNAFTDLAGNKSDKSTDITITVIP